VHTVRFDRLPIRPGYKVLDMGCGSGRHLGELSRRKGVTAVGADISLEDLLQARQRIQTLKDWGEHAGGTTVVLAADITRLPFADGFFDLVICSEVLEHIPEHEEAVKELTRVLKPGGNLVISVPRYLPERICWALSDSYHQVSRGHIRIYKKKEVIHLIQRAGNRLWDTHFAHGLHSPYWWLKCLVGPHREDSPLVKGYHRFLVWDLMKKPRITRWLERLLDPFIGKSIVCYFRKEDHV
jgi:SAM-dependent methyltransferase